jgi:hypothetical protein
MAGKVEKAERASSDLQTTNRTAGIREALGRTLLSQLDGLHQVLNEGLQVTERIDDVGSLVDLGERLAEDGDNVLEEQRSASLHRALVLQYAPGSNREREADVPRRSTRSTAPYPMPWS